MRIAVYGGSFDPPHVGHAMVASWIRWTDRAEEVWLVPARGHAFGKELRPFAFRRSLCEALADQLGPWARVCDIEGELPVPSYTIDTLCALRDRFPEHRFRYVLGADNLEALPRWKRWEAIAEEFEPIVVGRQGYPAPEGAVVFPDVSSTEIRRRLGEGRPVDHLVPVQVCARFGDAYRGGPRPTTP